VTRIVAGVYGGRRLAAPPGQQTRPTSDRVREALFSSLESLYGGHLRKLRFVDLYAGSGAIGLEALSRGAAYAVLVESDPKAARIIRSNIGTLGVAGQSDLFVAKVTTAVAGPPPGGPFDIVFADPPYDVGEDELAAVLSGLAANGWLAEDATVVVERSRRAPEPPWVEPVTADRSRKYGETTLWYGRAARTGAAGPDEQGTHQAEGKAQ
jgi:16S rRNA (guanine966-N2)-methyltransferase